MTLVANLERQFENLTVADNFEATLLRYSSEMVAWVKLEERKMPEVGEALSRFTELAYKEYRGSASKREICCRLLRQMMLELDEDFFILRSLYQVHKRSLEDPSQLDQRSPAWSEQLEGPEQKLFLEILNRRKLPGNIAEVFLNSYVREGASARGLFLATHIKPSLVVAKLVRLQEETCINMIRQFPDEPRCRIFSLLLNHNTACSLLLASRIAAKIYVTTVSQMVTNLESFAKEPEAQEALKCLYKAEWVLDPRKEKNQCAGLSTRLATLAAQCDLKRFPESRWMQKIQGIETKAIRW